jgi:UDP-glucose 4-epimerase
LRTNRRLFALGWKPRFDDLPAMVEHAYNWQRTLAKRPPVLDETVRV